MIQGERIASKGTVAVVFALLGLFLFPTWASAELVVATSGSEADQVANPQGLAVDTTSKRLYATDSRNERVDVWNAETGAFIEAFGWGVLSGAAAFEQCDTVCRSGLAGSEAGQFENPRGIAVDNDPASTSHQAVYVGDFGNRRIQKFDSDGNFILAFGDGVNETTGGDVCTALSGDTCGPGVSGEGPGQFNGIIGGKVAVGAGGVVYVADRVEDGGVSKTRVQSFSPAGVLLGQILLPVAGGAGEAVGFTLDPGGNYIVGTNGIFGTGAVRKYDSSGTLIWTRHPSFNINTVAADSSGNVFVTDNTEETIGDKTREINAIYQYDPAGTLLRVFYGSLKSGANTPALAPYKNSNGDIFAGESRIGSNPEGRVLHVDIPPPGPVAYPPGMSANPIGNVKATLHAEINPEGKATTFHFDYVDEESFEEDGWASPNVISTPESGSIGSDFKLYPATQQVTGLTPETDYLFRVVASNADAPAGSPGPDATFTTEPPIAMGPTWATDVGTETATLHGEANPLGISATGYFEYVDDATYEASGFDNAAKAPAGTPIDFGSGEAFVEGVASIGGLSPATTYHYRLVAQDNCKPLEPSVVCTFTSDERTLRTFSPAAVISGCPNDLFRTDAAAYLTDCRGYEMVSPVDKNGVNVEVVFNTNGYPAGLDQAAPAGDKITYSAYRAFANPKGSPYTSQYMAGRTAEGWQTESISPPREGASLYNFEGLEYQFKAFTADLCSGWPLQDTAKPLLDADAIPGYPNLYRRDNCGPDAETYEALTTSAPTGLSEPRLFYPELQGFSADGSVGFFGAEAKLTPETNEGATHVYEARGGSLTSVCVLPGGAVATTGCSLGTGNNFRAERNSNLSNAVSDDGSVLYWTAAEEGPGELYVRINGEETFLVSNDDEARFWTASPDGSRAVYSIEESLFVFDLGTKLSTKIAEGVRGLAGWSEDATVLYFASTKNLDAGAVVGQPNLYRYAGGDFKFIGTLLGDDVLSNRPSSISVRPVLRTARVTPDGDQVVFMSKASLTGYDNKDAVSETPDSEVFLYDATANGGAGQLRCVSCNPTEGRPLGRQWELVGVEGKWAAAWIPGWTNQLYAPRVISDDGSRVFFNSFDRLEARDTNEEQDVYEWEAPGSGDCDEDAALYSAPAGGCISLISSGQSPQGSELVDSSASGQDVFFKTYSSLVSQDSGLIDIYDARLGGGFKAPPPIVPPNGGCKGETCQPPPPPPPAHPAAPQSSTFVGPGDVVEKPKPKCPKGKHRVKRKGKYVCVKNKKHKKANKNRRQPR